MNSQLSVNVLPRVVCRSVILLCLISALVPASWAGDKPCDSVNSDCVKVGSWEVSLGVGLGGRTNPVVDQDDQPIILLPSINYYGKRFFWQTDTLGFTLLDTSRHQLNIILTPSNEQIYFKDLSIGNFSIDGGGASSSSRGSGGFNSNIVDDSDQPLATPVPSPTPTPTPIVALQNTPPELQESDVRSLDDRDTAALLGFEYSAYYEPFNFGLQVLQDVGSVHEGVQARAYVSLKSKLSERQKIEWLLGGEWRDEKVHDYYFGVRRNEVYDASFVYQAEAGFSPHVKIDWRYALTKQWQLMLVLNHRFFSEEISDSPLVNEDGSTAAFFGGVYHF